MYVIPEYTVTAILFEAATAITLRTQKPDLEGVIRTLLASNAQEIKIAPRLTVGTISQVPSTAWIPSVAMTPDVR